MVYARLACDVDREEEAELQRLEAGTPDEEPVAQRPPPPRRVPTDPDELLFRCASKHQRTTKDTLVGGQLLLTRRLITFAAHGAPPSVTISLAAVSAFRQSKAEAATVMAKMVLQSGESHIFHFERLEDRARFHETFSPLSLQSRPPSASGTPRCWKLCSFITDASTSACFNESRRLT